MKTLDVRNRKLIASKMYGVNPDYFEDKGRDASSLESSNLLEDGEPNPFINQRDLKNLRILFKKLNDNIDKLKVFQQRAKTLSDIEIVQQKLKQFGAALGFAEVNLAKKEIKEKEEFESQKLRKFSKQQGQSNIEQEYIKA